MNATSGTELSFLFVVTYGRSGSTTLQAVLNSIPGYLIRGENRQALKLLHQYNETLVKDRDGFQQMHQRRGTTMTPSDPFYGIDGYDEDVANMRVRELVLHSLLRPEPDTRVTGYKEIRWYQPDVQSFIDWLRCVFPGARFVFNSRRHEVVAASGWWAKDPEALRKLEKMESRFAELRSSLAGDAFHLQYEDYVGRPAAFEDLFSWLGEPFDEHRVAHVLERRHSY